MPHPLESYVIDSCFIFDLRAGNILECLRSCPFELRTTDAVEDELPASVSLGELGVQVEGIPGSRLFEVVEIMETAPGISYPDSSVAWLAKERGEPLITNDPKLRSASRTMGIRVWGTLWFVDSVVERRAVLPEVALDALLRMILNGRRSISEEEYRERLARWSPSSLDET